MEFRTADAPDISTVVKGDFLPIQNMKPKKEGSGYLPRQTGTFFFVCLLYMSSLAYAKK